MTEPIPQDVMGRAREYLDSYLYGKMSPDEAIARAILAERERIWAYLETAPGAAIDAMAAERDAGSKRNGHGNHAYRDEWLAGVRAIRGGS